METHTNSTYTTETTTHKGAARRAIFNALMVVGFIALLIIGIMLAIYSARYIPGAISKINLPKTDTSDTPPNLTVVSSTTTIPFTTTTTTLTPPKTSEDTIDAPVTKTVATHPRVPYGNPDLAVTILSTGYLAGDSTDSFVPASIIPPGARPAVKFSIADVGTNSTGPWNFLAKIPNINGTVFNSPIEPSMNPGDHIVFTLGFNQALLGPAQTITVIADPANQIVESNEGNNSAAVAVTITQTGN